MKKVVRMRADRRLVVYAAYTAAGAKVLTGNILTFSIVKGTRPVFASA